MTILNQGDKKTCANYALMGILLQKWIKFDLERLSTIRVPYIGKLEELFKKEGLVKELIEIKTFRLVDYWLKRWEWLITATSRWDFTLEDNDGNALEFDEGTQHFFILVDSIGDRWKCANSWGEGYGEKGYFYMKKKDFKYLITPRRVVVNK